jgi:peroxiredoxin
MAQRKKPFVRIAVLVVATFLVGLIWVNRDKFTPLDVGSRAPDYSAVSLSGDTVALDSFRGDVVLLNIWATWCKPCVYEMPALQRLHENLGSRGLRIVAVSVDAAPGVFGRFGQQGGNVAEFTQRFGLTFPVLHDPSGGIQDRYQVSGLPTTYLIDRDGRIRRKVIGAVAWDEPAMADQIRTMLEN